ncbi:hypothetical protein [Streptomyces asiaticus]|uniref:hypothetical protein n=1 Tax=Streptomyces asiaticus TaxID=114695 RepID=UPI003F66832A
MESIDRSAALGEATFAALETVLHLFAADRFHDTSADDTEVLMEALRSARAAVVATGYALVKSADIRRTRN